MSKETRILIVDDEAENLFILRENLEDAGHQTISASNGAEAWALLEKNEPDYFDVILLDRMMPVMDGMEVLRKIRGHKDYKMIPVIMQTASGERHEILEGMEAGCYHYLVKPFDGELMLSIIRTAVIDNENYRAIKKETQKHTVSMSLMDSGRFRFRAMDDGRTLAAILGNTCGESDKVALGLTELLINAVEHGNLEISFSDKTALLEDGDWVGEVEQRQVMPEYVEREVSVEFERRSDKITFVICDEGKGFDWQKYLDYRPEQMLGSHGRGIILASTMCFDKLEFNEAGNQVTATVDL